APVRRQHRLEGGPWLLTAARLDYHKGIDTVIRALPAIRAVFPTVRYAVAGIGSRRDALERLVRELGLGDAVRLLGFVSVDGLPAACRRWAASTYGRRRAGGRGVVLQLGPGRGGPDRHRPGVPQALTPIAPTRRFPLAFGTPMRQPLLGPSR